MTNILVTGGCGFIGSRLVRKLHSLNYSVRVIDNFSVGDLSDLPTPKFAEQVSATNLVWADRIQVLHGSILESADCEIASAGADVVIHLAANTGVQPSILSPKFDANTNIFGTINLLEACRINNCRKFIFSSSGAPIGQQAPPLHENLAPKPASPYGASKLAGEGYCRAYYESFGINTAVLRFSNIYGPASKKKHSVVASFIKNITNGSDVFINGDGSQTRDFLYVDDLIDAILCCIPLETNGEVFQIASGVETSISTLFSIIQDIYQTKGIHSIRTVYRSNLIGDVQRNYSDISKAKKLLQWTPKVELKAGLVETIEYFDRMGS